MTTKLGLHLLAHPSIEELRGLLARWQPPVLKSLGTAGEIQYLINVADVIPTAKIIQRFYWFDALGNTDQFDLWYRELGERTLDHWIDIVNHGLVQQSGNPRLYIESFNEVGMGPEYLAFETRRTYALMERYGLKSAVINSAVGTTSPQAWEAARAAGLLDAVRNTGSVIGLHAYAGFFMSLWHGTQNLGDPANGMRLKADPRQLMFRPIIPYDDPDGVQSWLAFRCRQDHEYLKRMGYGDLRIVLTEFGIDNAGYDTYKNYTGDMGRGGWRAWVDIWRQYGFLINNLTPEQFYAIQLMWADQQLRQFPFLDGATIFTYGSDPGTLWTGFDIRPKVAEHIVNMLTGVEPFIIPDYNNPNQVAVAPAEVVNVPTLVPTPVGPGMIHGSPDYHFAILGGSSEQDWFFSSAAAQRYWATFRPTLINDPDMIAFLPFRVSLMLTLIVTPSNLEAWIAQIRARFGNVGLDIILVEGAAHLEEVLASRVAANRRFG
jgi:hypothetical protein